MIVGTRASLLRLLAWQWRHVSVYVAAGLMGWLAIRDLGLHWLELPTLPMTVVGGALGIFVSFRTNAGYDRWWEGRKLWGQLVNTSRMFASQVVTYLGPAHGDAAARLVHRHIAYVHMLRRVLRNADPWIDPPLLRALPDDADPMRGQSNPTHALLDRQMSEIDALVAAGALSRFAEQSLDKSLATLLDVQGGCERIQKTPLPGAYGFLAERLVTLYSLMLPFSLVHDLGAWAIPVSVLVCLSFTMISETGRVLEDPFTMFYNGLPLHALSATIERNLRECLGESGDALPEIPQPVDGILM
jgi:putative membrane protein